MLDAVPAPDGADAAGGQLLSDGGEHLGVGAVDEDDLGAREAEAVDLDLLRAGVVVSAATPTPRARPTASS